MAFGMNDLVPQAKIMKKKMDQVQENLKEMTVDASSGGGMVKVVVNGASELTSIEIDPSVINAEDPEMLQDLILTAVNEGVKMSKELAESEMSQVTGGVNIPGMF